MSNFTKKFLMKTLLYGSFILSLVACSGVSTETSNSGDANGDGSMPSEIYVSLPESPEISTKEDSIKSDNCLNSSSMDDQLTSQQTVRQSIIIDTGVNLVGGAELPIYRIIQGKLELEIRGSYERVYEEVKAQVSTFDVGAAPGKYVIHTFFIEQQEFKGYVNYEVAGQQYSSPYSYTLIYPKGHKATEIPCPTQDGDVTDDSTNTTIPPTNPTIVSLTPTASIPIPTVTTSNVIVPTVMPQRELITEFIIQGNDVSGELFNVTQSGTYIFEISGGTYSPYPAGHPDDRGWRTAVLFYKNRNILWGEEYQYHEPIEANFTVGNREFITDEKTAELFGINTQHSEYLNQDDKIIMIVLDDQESYEDNRGAMIVRIWFVR